MTKRTMIEDLCHDDVQGYALSCGDARAVALAGRYAGLAGRVGLEGGHGDLERSVDRSGVAGGLGLEPRLLGDREGHAEQ